MSIISDTIEKVKRTFEKPDPTPVEVPVRFRKTESVDERIARIVQHSLSKEAEKQGFESFDDADDFDIPDDPIDPSTPWENDFDLASAQSVSAGVTVEPSIDPARVKELKTKYASKPKASQEPLEPPLPMED